MLFDSGINVYEERNVNLQTENVFNIRGHKQKVLSKKEKEKQEERLRERILNQKIKEKRKKAMIIEQQAPQSLGSQLKIAVQNNPHLFVAEGKEEIDVGLKDELSGDSDDQENFDDYDKRQEVETAKR